MNSGYNIPEPRDISLRGILGLISRGEGVIFADIYRSIHPVLQKLTDNSLMHSIHHSVVKTTKDSIRIVPTVIV